MKNDHRIRSAWGGGRGLSDPLAPAAEMLCRFGVMSMSFLSHLSMTAGYRQE
jgi:hypothetical protein